MCRWHSGLLLGSLRLPDKAVPRVILGWPRISFRRVDKLALKLARVPILTQLATDCFS